MSTELQVRVNTLATSSLLAPSSDALAPSSDARSY